MPGGLLWLLAPVVGEQSRLTGTTLTLACYADLRCCRGCGVPGAADGPDAQARRAPPAPARHPARSFSISTPIGSRCLAGTLWTRAGRGITRRWNARWDLPPCATRRGPAHHAGRPGGRRAGFAKTALLSDRARRGRRPWMRSLDEADNDPPPLVAGRRRAGPGVAGGSPGESPRWRPAARLALKAMVIHGSTTTPSAGSTAPRPSDPWAQRLRQEAGSRRPDPALAYHRVAPRIPP